MPSGSNNSFFAYSNAFCPCRSNKCAPGVDGQDFVDIEAYGLQRWLGELVVVVKRRQQPRPETTLAHGLLILKLLT
jgi:hypothetical protein